MDFLAISGCDTSLYHSQGGAMELSLCALWHDCNKMFYLIPNSRKSNSTATEIFVVRFRCIVSTTIYYLVHFWCTVLGETACIPYSVICDSLFDGAATSGISLQCAALTNTDWLHWLTCYIFTRESSYCFRRVLAIAILSVHLSQSHQSKAVQARITKFSPSAARNYRYVIQIENLVFCILAWTPQFSANLLNRNCYRLLRISWALAQISCLLGWGICHAT